jgi:hypothetical protein
MSGLRRAVRETPQGPSPHGPSARTLNELMLAGKELAYKVQAAHHDSAVSQYPRCENRSQARVQRCRKLLQQSSVECRARVRTAQKPSQHQGAGSYLHALCLQRGRAAPKRQDGRHWRLVAWVPARTRREGVTAGAARGKARRCQCASMARTCAGDIATCSNVYISEDKVECLQVVSYPGCRRPSTTLTCHLTPAPSALVQHTAAC